MNNMPALFRWIEENLGQEGAENSIVTDWAVSNTTLEEVFIQLARKEQTKSNQDATNTTNTEVLVPVTPVVLHPWQKCHGGRSYAAGARAT